MKHHPETEEKLNGAPKPGDVSGWARGTTRPTYPTGAIKLSPAIKLQAPSAPRVTVTAGYNGPAAHVCATPDGQSKRKPQDLDAIARSRTSIADRFASFYASRINQ